MNGVHFYFAEYFLIFDFYQLFYNSCCFLDICITRQLGQYKYRIIAITDEGHGNGVLVRCHKTDFKLQVRNTSV
ncbi:hypothetical protein SAMN05421690_106214 [Nitrosomonas sp. Nm51]|nr:hypothetical protein SAMN05421690_106214 [Nitrosomonas sp. Nm51]